MSTRPRVLHTLAFGRHIGAGSPASVVLNANAMTTDAMQKLAASEQPETTFVLVPAEPRAPWRMRFFLQGREMSMCVHGTVGALAALSASEPSLPREFEVETGVGVIAVDWRAAEEGSFICIDQFAPEFGPPIGAVDAILHALGADASALDRSGGPVQRVSVSRPKLMVPVVDLATLDALKPDSELLELVCGQYDATGIYAFTRHSRADDHDVNARQFPTGAEMVEDAATGVAAAALAAYLFQYAANCGSGHNLLSPDAQSSAYDFRVRIAQGDALGCPCLLEAIAVIRDGVVVKTRVCGLGSGDR